MFWRVARARGDKNSNRLAHRATQPVLIEFSPVIPATFAESKSQGGASPVH
jgi:hypothetical protein